MKDTILRQRKLLQNKQRLIRYFRNRIQTQKEFLDMLNQKFNMNASTESELKANNFTESSSPSTSAVGVKEESEGTKQSEHESSVTNTFDISNYVDKVNNYVEHSVDIASFFVIIPNKLVKAPTKKPSPR
ncbi:unnamed protein product [Acanthoscelides obtectus]|uniref:Uncharacterized protein n=1 Tax=Acanthoscelides obtectus TaxID=200917 RepID=A0A9P0M7L9_ACAOB|nr:unnamed protein product [Acanthoscelides obtectus]CAK1624187.1 hypothetical protein AOBTE_LOCUS2383 [Acanthoscelides obtectus]